MPLVGAQYKICTCHSWKHRSLDGRHLAPYHPCTGEVELEAKGNGQLTAQVWTQTWVWTWLKGFVREDFPDSRQTKVLSLSAQRRQSSSEVIISLHSNYLYDILPLTHRVPWRERQCLSPIWVLVPSNCGCLVMMDIRMDGWMDGWMDEWTGEQQMDGWMNRWTADGWMDGQMNWWKDRLVFEWVDK